MSKSRAIKEELEVFDANLAAAANYPAQGKNIEGKTAFHLDDWNGKSGHPLWMKNVMIPRTMKFQIKKERALEKIAQKDKELKKSKRRSPLTR